MKHYIIAIPLGMNDKFLTNEQKIDKFNVVSQSENSLELLQSFVNLVNSDWIDTENHIFRVVSIDKP